MIAVERIQGVGMDDIISYCDCNVSYIALQMAESPGRCNEDVRILEPLDRFSQSG